MISLYKLKKYFLKFYKDICFNVCYCSSECHSPFDDANVLPVVTVAMDTLLSF